MSALTFILVIIFLVNGNNFSLLQVLREISLLYMKITCESYKKLASRSWPVLFTPTIKNESNSSLFLIEFMLRWPIIILFGYLMLKVLKSVIVFVVFLMDRNIRNIRIWFKIFGTISMFRTVNWSISAI